MTEPTPRARADRAFSMVLQRLIHGKAKELAEAMGLAESELSDLKNKRMEPCLLLLSHLGLKVVDQSSRCMTPVAFEFLTEQHERMVAKKLAWGEDDE